MAISATLSNPDATASQALPTMPWQTRDVASINRRFFRFDTLPAEHGHVLSLYINEGLTEVQIATRLGFAPKVVRHLLTEGLAPLDDVESIGKPHMA
jgi:hypothetical protein